MKTLTLFFAVVTTAILAKADSFPALEKFSRTCVVSASAELSLKNINGSVEIVAWDKNEVLITAEKRARTEEDLQKIQINVGTSASRVEITTDYVRTGWFGRTVRGSAHYKVMVPAGINLRKIDVVNSNIVLRGITGEVEAVSVNGSIRAADLANSARLKTVNGNIEAAFLNMTSAREVHAKTVNGSCKLTLPELQAAQLDASTVNGRVTSDLPVNTVKCSRTKFQGRVGTGDGLLVEARSVNGNITFQRES